MTNCSFKQKMKAGDSGSKRDLGRGAFRSSGDSAEILVVKLSFRFLYKNVLKITGR